MGDEEFTAVIRECMLYKDPIGLKKFILEDKYSQTDVFWELMTILGKGLNEENNDSCPGFFEACERCMTYLIRVGNPKELLLALLEEGDTLNDPIRFQTYLQLFQHAILKLPSKHVFSLELTLETLNHIIRNLELPANLDLEGEERQAHDLDPNVDNINRYLITFLDFLRRFMDELFNGKIGSGNDKDKLKACFNSTLLKLLDYPLVYLDLTLTVKNERIIRSNSRICAERVVSLLNELNGNSLAVLIENLIENNDRIDRFHGKRDLEDTDTQEYVPVLSIACLTYLIYRESVIDAKNVCLCTAEGHFENNLVFMLELMKQKASEVHAKGVMLLQHLIQQLDESTVLPYEDLDRQEYFRILEALFHVMVYSSVKDIRKTCAFVLPLFIKLFDLKARYQIFVKIFGTVQHSGAYGYCVQLFKNQLEEVLSGSQTGSREEDLFCNIKLKRILLLITSLPDDSATDMVENSDRLIAVLNFIRYLVLRDAPSANRTGFWSFLALLQKDFIKPMQVGLDMSKGHYKCELVGLESGKVEHTGDKNAEMSVSVAGFSLPKMDRRQKLEIMKQALNTLDLMTSLFVRVNELIDQKQKESKA